MKFNKHNVLDLVNYCIDEQIKSHQWTIDDGDKFTPEVVLECRNTVLQLKFAKTYLKENLK